MTFGRSQQWQKLMMEVGQIYLDSKKKHDILTFAAVAGWTVCFVFAVVST